MKIKRNSKFLGNTKNKKIKIKRQIHICKNKDYTPVYVSWSYFSTCQPLSLSFLLTQSLILFPSSKPSFPLSFTYPFPLHHSLSHSQKTLPQLSLSLFFSFVNGTLGMNNETHTHPLGI